MFLVNQSDLKSLIRMEEVIGAVEKAFGKYGQGDSILPEKTQFFLPTEDWKWWAFMPCYVGGSLGVKVVSDYSRNTARPTIQALMLLCDENNGSVKAIMDATYLTAVRTGALGAIAVKYLSRKDSEVLGILGCGVQSRTQLEGISKVRELKKVLIHDVNESAIDKFIADMQKLKIPIEKSTAEKIAMDSDIIVTATTSKMPVLEGRLVSEGAHINSIGAHTQDARELDYQLMKKAKVVIDSPDALKSGDLKNPLEDGLLKIRDIVEIKDVLMGKKVREKIEDITLFKSVGTGIQDVAIATLVYQKAMESGRGVEIDLSI
jgi:alanine dehydrogenase